MNKFEEDKIQTARQLWASMWPGVPFEAASPEDRKMILGHASSVADWKEWRRLNGK